MFGNGTFTSNKTNGVNVNTRLTTLYADDSMVSIGAWNTNLSIKFHPATGKNADGLTQYAQDNNSIVNIVLTPDNVRVLIEGINNEIIPAIISKESKNVAVTTGSGNNLKILCVATENGEPYMYVAKNLMNGITDDSNVTYHHFSTRTYLSNYSYKDGSNSEVKVNTGFKNFVKRLEGMERIIPEVSHSISYSTAVRNAVASSHQNTSSDTPKYEALVSNFDGSNSSEFLPFA